MIIVDDMMWKRNFVSKLDMHFLVVFWMLIFSVQSSYAEINGQVQTHNLSFISPDFESHNSHQYTFIGASLESVKSDRDQFKVSLSGEYALGNAVLSTFNVREVYFSYFTENNATIHVGRRKQKWSEVDELWNLGFFQPQFRAHPFEVETQGLTGIFYEHKQGLWSINLFGSHFFVPDQGPNFELKDGQFTSANPYFPSPPQNVYFQNTLLPIDYNIQKPETTDVIYQTSFGLQINYGNQTGFYSDFSTIYQPSNQLAYGWRGVLVTDRVRVDVVPKTYYEKVFNFDFGYRDDWGMVGVSTLYLNLEQPDFSEQYNQPVYSNNVTIGPHLNYNINNFSIHLSGLFNQNGEVNETGPNVDQFKRSLSQKFLYQNAYQIQLGYKILILPTLKYKTILKWLETDKNLLKTISWKNTIDFKGPWKMMFDLYLVETSDDVSNVSNYRNLDQALLGVVYEF